MIGWCFKDCSKVVGNILEEFWEKQQTGSTAVDNFQMQ